MTKGLLFWIIMILWLIASTYWLWPSYHLVGGNILIWILLALVGWKVFGPPIQG